MTTTEIAVRLYNNPKFGTTYGKGQYHNAIMNGTVDLHKQSIKYLIDLVPHANWEASIKTDNDMELLAYAEECYEQVGIKTEAQRKDLACSWIKRFDNNLLKPRVIGFALMNLSTGDFKLLVLDEEKDVKLQEQLTVKSCRDASSGQRSPNLFASNYDLAA